MLRITYVGPFEAVEIADSGQVVEFGEEVEVEDELALRLLEQDVWESEDPAVEALQGLLALDAAQDPPVDDDTDPDGPPQEEL